MGAFSGGTIAGNILFDVTGRDIGSLTARPDVFTQDLNVSGNVTLPTSYANGVSVFQYGAVGDGITDDSAAFNLCAAANTVILVPGGYTYALTANTVNILAGQTWICNGATLTQASSAKTMFAATTVNDWSFYGGILTGSGNGSAGSGTNEILFKITDGLRYRLVNVTCKNSQGWGFKRISANAPAYRGEGGQYDNCTAIGCYIGTDLIAGSGAEYSTWTNFQAVNNNTGCQVSAGNTTFIGGSISDNANTGVSLAAGSNNTHGKFIGVDINHNTLYNVYANSITNGHKFVGCNLYGDSATAGIIYQTGSKGLQFVGCNIDSQIKNDSVGGQSIFANNYMVSATGQAAPNGSSGATSLALIGNITPTGFWIYNNAFDATNGSISAGVRATGIHVGDLSASQSATTGELELGSDGNKYLFRSTDQLQFGGFTSLVPATAALSSLGTAALPFSTVTVNQEVTPRSNVAVVNGANADVGIGASTFIKLTGPTGVFSISGFTGGSDGRKLVVYNSVAFAWTITNNATSTAANRILTLTGADVTLRAGQSSATFLYDSAQSLWVLTGTN